MNLPERDYSLSPRLEAPPEQVADLLRGMEAFDPTGQRAVQVAIPPVIAERCSPYIDTTQAALLSIRNARRHPGVQEHALGTVELQAPVDAQAVKRRHGETPTSIMVSYTPWFPVPGQGDNGHRGLYVQRSTRIRFRLDNGSYLHRPVEAQSRLDGTDPVNEVAQPKRHALSRLVGRVVARHAQEEPAEDYLVNLRRESWVSQVELDGVIGLLRQNTPDV